MTTSTNWLKEPFVFTDDRAIPPTKNTRGRPAMERFRQRQQQKLIWSFLFFFLFCLLYLPLLRCSSFPAFGTYLIAFCFCLFSSVLFLLFHFFSVAFFLCFAPHSNVFQRSVRRCDQQGQPVFAWFGLLKILHAYFLRWQILKGRHKLNRKDVCVWVGITR